MRWSAIGVVFPVLAWALLLARLSGDRHGFLKHLPTAAGLGLGTSSVVWWALMLFPLSSRMSLLAIDAAFWALTCFAVWSVGRSPTPAKRAPAPAKTDGPRPWTTRWLPLALLVVAVAGAGVYFVAASVTQPHGTWDAWAIWNARARFLFRGYPGVWMDAFSPALGWSHPDYPLLVPVSVVRAWTYIGGERVIVPIVLAATFCTGIVATAATSVARSGTAWRGVLTAVMILASPAFLASAVAQWADIPLAFYILTTCVSIGRATESGSRPAWWAVAGIGASLAAWTKNEGLVFAAIVLIVCSVWAYRSDRWRGLARLTPSLAGAAPVLVTLVVFKLFFAPTNDLLAAQSIDHVLANLRDLDRLQIVAAAVGKELWFGGASLVGVLPILAMFVLTAGIRRPVPTGPALGLACAGALIAADMLVYVLTPHDLAWHIRTSVDRVVIQVFPAIVWCGLSLADMRPRALTADDRASLTPVSGPATVG